MICCEGFLFFVGLSMVVSGRIQINQRLMDAQRVRLAGWILLCTPLVMLVAETLLMPSNITMDTDPFEAVRALGPLMLVQMSIFIGSLYLAWWIITRAPSEPVKPFFPMQQMPPAPEAEPVYGKVLTLSEAARYLRVSEDAVLELINTNQLAAARIGGEYRIARIALDDYLAQGSGATD